MILSEFTAFESLRSFHLSSAHHRVFLPSIARFMGRRRLVWLSIGTFRLWNLFNRHFEDPELGHQWGVSVLQVRRRHLLGVFQQKRLHVHLGFLVLWGGPTE